MPCVFCQIAIHRTTAHIVFEDDDVIAFLDKYPISEGHTLVIPKKHYARLDDLPEDLLIKLILTARRLNTKIRESMNATGSHVSMNDGRAARQLIPHVHIHIIPRKEGDNASFGSRKRLSPQQMELIRRKIIQSI
jgi:histidine triad (HIT) family protein